MNLDFPRTTTTQKSSRSSRRRTFRSGPLGARRLSQNLERKATLMRFNDYCKSISAIQPLLLQLPVFQSFTRTSVATNQPTSHKEGVQRSDLDLRSSQNGIKLSFYIQNRCVMTTWMLFYNPRSGDLSGGVLERSQPSAQTAATEGRPSWSGTAPEAEMKPTLHRQLVQPKGGYGYGNDQKRPRRRFGRRSSDVKPSKGNRRL